MKLLAAEEVRRKCSDGAVLVDIRSEAEYRRRHIGGALCLPLNRLQDAGLPPDLAGAEAVVFHCFSGMRTSQAAAALEQLAQGRQVYILEGGLQAWQAAGLPVEEDRSQPLDLMRQVQIAAGSIALTGALGGWLVSPWLYMLCGLVGAGLLTAGLTGFCGMARILLKMLWNQPSA